MESDDAVQRRLFLNSPSANSSPDTNSLTPPDHHQHSQSRRRNMTGRDGGRKNYVSIAVILAILAALGGTYVAELKEADVILKSGAFTR